MWTLRKPRLALTLALLLGICPSFLAVPAQAQGPVITPGPYKTSFGVRCQDGQCSLSADLGAGEVDVAVPARHP